MKTTIELPDDLLIEAKAVAVRRRTTLKEMITRSLQREIGAVQSEPLPNDSPYELNEMGLPQLKKQGSSNPNAQLHRLLAEEDVEDAVAYLDSRDRDTKSDA